ncbi:hypothetical protein [Luteimonas sp. TWI1437]|uniref:dioxygenase family protein n=1 Tax=unclassified Luteimonas TaxID=2629088 RepID=UPI0032085D9D
MTLRKITISLVLAATIACPGQSIGQVDPFWLKSWHEAVRHRPQRMGSQARIAPADEPGTPLTVHGRVVAPDGETPAPGVVVHAYHRDRDGLDFGPGDHSLSTWRLQGWALTDHEGRFRFDTIRPAADAMGRDGAHIHFTLESPDAGRQWAPIVYLADDPRVGERERVRSAKAGRFGWVRQVERVGDAQQMDVWIRLKPAGEF